MSEPPKVQHNGKTTRLHRATFEKVLDAPLPNNMCVHHIDGNPQNNRIDNLAACTHRGHQQLHALQQGKQIHPVNRRCEQCKKPFTPPRNKRDTAKFCSRTCAQEHTKEQAEKTRAYRTCPQCGATFWKPNRTTYCSKDCANKALAKPPTNKTCPVCDKPFMLTGRNRNRKTCSDICYSVLLRKQGHILRTYRK